MVIPTLRVDAPSSQWPARARWRSILQRQKRHGLREGRGRIGGSGIGGAAHLMGRGGPSRRRSAEPRKASCSHHHPPLPLLFTPDNRRGESEQHAEKRSVSAGEAAERNRTYRAESARARAYQRAIGQKEISQSREELAH